MTDQKQQISADSKSWVAEIIITVMREFRQYGIAAIVMLICMGALGWVFTYYEGIREKKDAKIEAVNDKVFAAFTANTKALENGAEAQEKTVKAIEDLRVEIRSSRN